MTLALALAHTAKPQPFNGLFYATAATVIPVFFLALVVQGPAARHLLNEIAIRPLIGWPPGVRERGRLARFRASTGRLGLAVAAACILLSGVLAEEVALLDLYDQQSQMAGLVIAGVAVMLIAAVALPFATYPSREAVKASMASSEPGSPAARAQQARLPSRTAGLPSAPRRPPHWVSHRNRYARQGQPANSPG